MENRLTVDNDLAEMTGLPLGVEMQLIASVSTGGYGMYETIEQTMFEKAIGPGRRIYEVFERRNLIRIGKSNPFTSLLAIKINGSDRKQEEPIDATVFQFCQDQRNKSAKLLAYYAEVDKVRWLLIITPAAKTTCG